MAALTLQVAPGLAAVVRLGAEAQWRAVAAAAAAEALNGGPGGSILSVTRTAEEVSIVAALPLPKRLQDLVDAGHARCEGAWRTLKVAGPLDFGLVGVLAKLLVPLAEAQVPVFVSSTFDTDYIMVKEDKLDAAVDALRRAGSEVSQPDEAEAAAAAAAAAAAGGPQSPQGVAGLEPFALERYFAKYEFTAPHLLCCSDCESLSLSELLAMADTECKELWQQLSLGYTESAGLPQLRAQVAQHYNEGGIGPLKAELESVVVLAPEEGIYLTARALLAPGDHVIVPRPCYQSLSEVAKSMGCELSYWGPRQGEDGSWSFCFADVADMVRPDTKMVVINVPHNTTGAMLSTADFADLVALCQEHDCYLFSDEMYRGLEFDPADRLPAAFTCFDKGISLGGVSKSLSVPGLRIGWIACRDPVARSNVQLLKDYTTICPPAPSEVLALIALRNAGSIVERNLGIMRVGLAALAEFMDKHRDKFAFAPPRAGPISFPRLLREPSALDFCRRLVEGRGIMLLPSSVYGEGVDPCCVRLGFARRNVPDVLRLLDDYLSQAPAAVEEEEASS